MELRLHAAHGQRGEAQPRHGHDLDGGEIVAAEQPEYRRVMQENHRGFRVERVSIQDAPLQQLVADEGVVVHVVQKSREKHGNAQHDDPDQGQNQHANAGRSGRARLRSCDRRERDHGQDNQAARAGSRGTMR